MDWAPVDPGGPVDPTVAVQPAEEVDRPAAFTLMAPGWRPPQESVTQASGLCFDPAGRVVLVCQGEGYWTLPGGRPEAGESPLEALVREVAEEACARVLHARYLACQHVWDPRAPSGPTSHYQTRFWARVELDGWQPQPKIHARSLVAPELVTARLSWQRTKIAARLLELAMAEEEADAHRHSR
jgi:ADP-ribose pyrophosphatase YjhB (NUDIX family)